MEFMSFSNAESHSDPPRPPPKICKDNDILYFRKHDAFSFLYVWSVTIMNNP